ncbi:RNA-dependent RNA polymerase [Shallot virus S]|uniref:RNA-dependent RNA polymerase n=1 Tax=Shallot virus S TaxID=2586033 RepID=A0AAE6FPG1_9VIRU|nr:RNA-dependent RNA polymerase [Shallot virus S]QCY49482.1 RNA-dependent RNA polymerase [Shallot virus S]
MALTYRSPVEEVLTSFTTSEQSEIARNAVQSLKDMEHSNHNLFNFALSPIAKQKICDAGIYLSPFSYVPHSHAACKTLENYHLYSVVCPLLDHNYYLVGIKSSKLSFLKSRNKKVSMAECLNRLVTSRDKVRYSNDFVIQSGVTGSVERKMGGVDFFPEHADIAPLEIKLRSRNMFLHDELHYWSAKSLNVFLDQCRPNMLLATVVIPPELLLDAKESMNHWCYEYEIEGDDLLFYPDGVRSEGYIQPKDCIYLLKTNKIVTTSGLVYNIDIISSKFAHHVIAITQGDCIRAKFNSFSGFDAIGTKYAEKLLHKEYPCFPISYDVVMKLYTYLSSLNTPDVKSAVAKLRQLVNNPTAFEVQFTKEFAEMYIKTGVDRDLFTPQLTVILKHHIAKLMPGLLTKYYKSLVRINLTEFVSNLQPLSFNIKCETLDFCTVGPSGNLLKDFMRNTDQCDIDAFLEQVILSIPDRDPQPYFVSTPSTHELHDDPERILGVLLSYLPLSEATLYTSSENLMLEISKIARDLPFLIVSTLDESTLDRVYLTSLRDSEIRRMQEARTKTGLKYLLGSLPSGDTHEDETVLKFNHEQHQDLKWGVNELTEELGTMPLNAFYCICNTIIPWAPAFSPELLLQPCLDRLNNRTASFYSKSPITYNYTGGSHKSVPWIKAFDDFLMINGHDLDYYNCVLLQRYDGGSGIGFHSDDEVIFEEGARILTVCVTGDCDFRFRCAYGECGFLMDGPKQFIMGEGFQETHKHSVRNCSAGRVSATFRRAVFNLANSDEPPVEIDITSDSETSSNGELTYEHGLGVTCTMRANCDVSNFNKLEVSGANNMCFWNCLSFFLNLDAGILKDCLARNLVSLEGIPARASLELQLRDGAMVEEDAICLSCKIFSINITVYSFDLERVTSYVCENAERSINLHHHHEHFSILVYKNDCFVNAVAQTFSKSYKEMYAILSRNEFKALSDLLHVGTGLTMQELEVGFRLLNIKAHVLSDGEYYLLNSDGEINGYYNLTAEHLIATSTFSTNKLASKTFIKTDDHITKETFGMLMEAGTEISFKPDVDRAQNLERSLLRGCTGILSSTLFSGRTTKLDDISAGTDRKVIAIVGTFGAGKTSLIKKTVANLKRGGQVMHFVSPRRSLADNLSDALGLERRRRAMKTKDGRGAGGVQPRGKKQKKELIFVRTFETFLLQHNRVRAGDVVFIDELQLFPPGYLDYALLVLPHNLRVVVMGDPLQSDYDSENDRHIFLDYSNDLVNLLSDKHYKYNSLSRRFTNKNFLGRLPCDFHPEGFILDESYLMVMGLEGDLTEIKTRSDAFLVSSFIEKNFVRAHFGDDIPILTFGESTGLTFKCGAIFITESSLKTSERRWVTALSRFAENLILINLLEVDFEGLARNCSEKALGKFLRGKASTADLPDLLPGAPTLVKGFYKCAGKNLGVREAKLVGDPWLKSELFLGQEVDIELLEVAEEIGKEDWFKTHLPRCELESLRACWSDKILLKEDREYKYKDMVTDQFTDTHSKQKGKVLTNQAERFETIYPRHRANDTLTFLMAVKKRLRFSKPHLENAKLKDARPFGKYLLGEFLKRIPLKAQGRSDLMAEAVHDFEEKKTSKPSAIIENHANRSCSDWLKDVGLVFSKSQICTKWDNRFRVAKAAQSIVCFQHSVLIRFAPYMRYIEKKVNEVLPSNYYIHSGKSLGVLNDWVIKNNFNSICTESDYEAFDASQDHFIMAFELELMNYLGLPKDLIADYVYIKTHLGCKMGSFAIMRFSGEASTFLFNTLANMLFTFLRYDLNGHESICFAGDDMCANKRLRISEAHSGFLDKLKLKAKVAFTKRPTFCGWNLTYFGIYKKPQLVIERMCIAKETNNLKNCIDNYAIEVSYAYVKGELAVCHMDEEELDAYYNCVRVIIKNKHLLESDIKLLFSNDKML